MDTDLRKQWEKAGCTGFENTELKCMTITRQNKEENVLGNVIKVLVYWSQGWPLKEQ